MEVLRSVPISTVKAVEAVFRYVEIVVQIQSQLVAIIFIIVFSKVRSIHKNLTIIISSFLISCLIASALRVTTAVHELWTPIEKQGSQFHIITSEMRHGAVYAVGFHPLLIAFERLLAAVRSKTYEQEKNTPLLLFLIFCVWAFSLCFVFVSRFIDNGLTIVCFAFFPIYAASITIFVCIRRSNLSLWQKNRGALQVSHNYQIRENVETAMWLFQLMKVVTIQFLTAWLSFNYLVHFLYKDGVEIVIKVFDFVFDISIALLPTTTSLTLYYHNGKLRWLSNAVLQNVGEEGAKYFQQYQMAWS